MEGVAADEGGHSLRAAEAPVENVQVRAFVAPAGDASDSPCDDDEVLERCSTRAATRIQALWRGFASRTWLLDLRGPWARLATLYRVIARGRITLDLATGMYRCRS